MLAINSVSYDAHGEQAHAPFSVLRYALTIHMVWSRDGEYLAGDDVAGAIMVGANMARANVAWANVAGANVAGAYMAGARS